MIRITKYILVVLFICLHLIDAQIISEINSIHPAGVIDINANNLSQTESVKWFVSSYYIDETDNKFENSKDTLLYEGESVKVLLAKKVGKYTYYKIFAGNNSFSDSVIVQVLNKGIPERYLFQNKSIPNKPIVVFVILPEDIVNAEFIMIMHGQDRNSLDYIQSWKTFGKSNNYVCAAPTFSDQDWPTSSSYNLGNMFSSANSFDFINPDSVWTFKLVSDIHNELVAALGMKNEKYNIWGHSAGAQFVHRLMTFQPDYKIQYALAANAGWYTLPDFDLDYPYGLKNKFFSYDETFLEDLVIKNLIIFRGTLDTVRDSYLNTSAEADKQGLNRFERAETYFKYASTIASNNKWKLIDVENSGHDYKLMAAAAQIFLINPTSVNTTASSIGNELVLYQNYPNPFNISTMIQFNVPSSNKSSIVNLSVFNLLGEEVSVIVNNKELYGFNSFLFNGKDKFNNDLSSGLYLFRLTVGRYSVSNKMVLLK